MTRRSRFAAPLAAAAFALFTAAGCSTQGSGMSSTTGMGPSAPAADRTGTAGAAGSADARVGAPGQRSQERGAPGAAMGGPNGPDSSTGGTSMGGSASSGSSMSGPNGTEAPSGDATGRPGMQGQPPIAQADDETLRACMAYRQMMAGKSPLEQQATWNAHLARVHGITDPQEAAMHQRNVERTCAQVMPGGMR